MTVKRSDMQPGQRFVYPSWWAPVTLTVVDALTETCKANGETYQVGTLLPDQEYEVKP